MEVLRSWGRVAKYSFQDIVRVSWATRTTVPISTVDFPIVGLALICAILPLVGCISSSIVGLYIISVRYTDGPQLTDPSMNNPKFGEFIAQHVGRATLEVRAGYFGLCIKRSSSAKWLCAASAEHLTQQLGQSEDPLNIVWSAETFKNNVMVPWLAIIPIALGLITIIYLIISKLVPADLPSETRRRRAQGRERSRWSFYSARTRHYYLRLIAFITAGLSLVAVLWQGYASIAVTQAFYHHGYGYLHVKIGRADASLAALSFVLFAISSLFGLSVA